MPVAATASPEAFPARVAEKPRIRDEALGIRTVRGMTKPSDCAVCALPALVLAEVRGLGRRRAGARLRELGYEISDGQTRRHLRDHVSPAEQLLGLPALPVVEPPASASAPKGWEPGIRWAPGAETAVLTLPASATPHSLTDAERELKRMGYDPAEWIIEPRELRHDPAAWGRGNKVIDGLKQGVGEAYTVDVWRAIYAVRRRTAFDAARDDTDLDDLRAWVGEMDAVVLAPSTPEDETLLVCLADWQSGKRDGDGLRGLMARLVQLGALIEARYRDLLSIGRRIAQIVLAGLGDLVEGCVGFYPSQTFQAEGNGRQQERVARRALTALIRRLSRLGVRIVVTGVPGNHGENRTAAGKSITSNGDNADLRVLESVAEVFEGAPGYEHVSFVVPEEELFIELDLSGRITLFQHGHVGPKGWAGLWSWFKNMISHRRTSATLLVVAHLHHEHYEQDGMLAIYQAPALEGESTWVRDAYGPATLPGTGTMLVSGRYGLRDHAVLS